MAAAFDFPPNATHPAAPAPGDVFGNYAWDGEKWQLATGSPTTTGVVRYDIAQALTAPQQVQARQNVYAAPFDAMAYSGMQINGSMDVSQEKGVAGTTVSNQYIVDGWKLIAALSSGAVNVAQSAYRINGFSNILAVSVAVAQATMAAGDVQHVYQIIEGYRIARLAWGTANAQPITIGFWTAHQRIGTYSVGVRNLTAPPNRSYVAAYTQNVSGALEYKTVTIPGCTDGTWAADYTGGLSIAFVNACGTTSTAPSAGSWQVGNYVAAPGQVNGATSTADVFRITGVVIFPGIEAPSAARAPLIMRPYDQELILCKRYWESTYDYGTLPGVLTSLGAIEAVMPSTIANAAFFNYTSNWFAIKRGTPTVTLYSVANGAAGKVDSNGVPGNATPSFSTQRLNSLQNNSGASWGVGTSLGFHVVVDARL